MSPEADLGGPLALVQMEIAFVSASAKTIDLLVTPKELERGRSTLLPHRHPHVDIENSITIISYPLQRDVGFDFLRPD